MTRWGPTIRRATVSIAIVVVLGLAVQAAAPLAIRWEAETRLAALLGREVHIGRVDVTPWTLDVLLRDVTVAAAAKPPSPAAESALPLPGASRLATLAVERMHLRFAWASIWLRAPVVQTFEIEGLRLNVARLGAGRYDVDDVIRRLGAGPSGHPEFAFYNVQLRDSTIVFDDRPASRVHSLASIRLTIPVVSTLRAQADVKVEPRLSFTLNGVPFDSSAVASPFSQSRQGALTLRFARLDLAPFLGYLPAALPLKLATGTLSGDLSLQFSSSAATGEVLQLRGTLSAENARLVDLADRPLLSWRRLDLDLRSAEPLQQRIAIAALRLEGARLAVRRNAAGTLDLTTFGRRGRPHGDSPVPSESASRADWHVVLDRLTLDDTSVDWNDASVEPAVSLQLDGLSAQFGRLEWPVKGLVPVLAKGSLHQAADSASPPGSFVLQGAASTQRARLDLTLSGLSLDAFEGYFARVLAPRVSGRLSTEARLDWEAPTVGDAGLRLTLETGALEAFALHERPAPLGQGPTRELAALRRVSFGDARIDFATREVDVGRLNIAAPSLALARGRDGRWDAASWIAPTAREPAPPLDDGPPPAPWRILLRDAVLADGRFDLTDARAVGTGDGPPLRLAFDRLRIAVQGLAWQGDRPTVPAQIEVRGRVGPPRAPTDGDSQNRGAFDWRGVVGVEPLLAIGSLKLERFPLHPFVPYVGRDLPLRVAHAELGFDGNLSVKQRPEGFDIDAGTDLLLGAVRLEAGPPAAAGETLLRWNTLGLKDLRLSAKPGLKPQLDIAQASLDDLYARLVVDENGKLNLSSVASSQADGATARPPGSPPSPRLDLPFDVRLDTTVLTNGRIDFSDHFIRPNYSAALTELTGRLGALRSDRPEPTALSLRGKAAATAQLDVEGTLDPLSRSPALDLRAKATDLELAPLSPYARKYAGYEIERGKMSMDLSYRLEPDGHLEATNRVVLNQLTFGARIDSPTATQLPVMLAVALLKDRNGVIDLDLPISGSLDDPQFSVGRIVGRLLGGLLVKAVTSPFALLGGGGSGGVVASESGRVEFVPGTARLSDAGSAVVEKVAAALAGKPDLVVTITGSVDPGVEQDAYRAAALDERLIAARRKQTVASANGAVADEGPPTGAARARFLDDLYAETDLPDKPLNVLGFAKDVPQAERAARLTASVPADTDAMRALALQRGVAVREALVAKGLPSERLFLASPDVRSVADTGASGRVPGAALSLSLR